MTGVAATHLRSGGGFGTLAEYVGAFVWGSAATPVLEMAQRGLRAISSPLGGGGGGRG